MQSRSNSNSNVHHVCIALAHFSVATVRTTLTFGEEFANMPLETVMDWSRGALRPAAGLPIADARGEDGAGGLIGVGGRRLIFAASA